MIATAVQQQGFQLLAVAAQGVTMQAVIVLLKGLAYLGQVFLIHCPRQLADAGAVLGAPVGAQHGGLLGECVARGLFGFLIAADVGAAGVSDKFDGALLITPLVGMAAQITHHSAGFHAGQLVLVAQQDQPGVGTQGFQQAGHHVHVDHAGFVHHHQIRVQRIVSVVTEVTAVRTGAEQAVQGGDFRGDGVTYCGFHLEFFYLFADGFCEPRRRLAGGGGEANTQALVVRHGQALQQPQQANHGGGLAGTGAAGNDADTAAAGQRTGYLLPVGLVAGVRE